MGDHCHEHVQPENPWRRGLSRRLAHPPAAPLGRPYGAPRRRLCSSPLGSRKRSRGLGRSAVIGTWGGDHGARYGETPKMTATAIRDILMAASTVALKKASR